MITATVGAGQNTEIMDIQNSTVILALDSLKVVDQPMKEVSAEKKRKLKESIARFGIIIPLIVNQNNEILEGRTRYGIAREMGLKYVRVLVCDTDKDPSASVLKYHLELYRRSLSEEEAVETELAMQEYEQTIIADTLDKLLYNVIPELRDNVRDYVQKTGDTAFLSGFARLAPEKQRIGISEVLVAKGELATVLSEKRQLENDLKLLQKKIKDYTILEERYKTILEEKEMLQDKIKGAVKRELEKIEAELKERYINNHTPFQFQKTLTEEKKKIESKYQSELDDTINERNKISKLLLGVKEEIQKSTQMINEIRREKKIADDLAIKYKKMANSAQEAMKQMASSSNVVKRLKCVARDGEGVNKRIDMLSEEIKGVLKTIIKLKSDGVEINDTQIKENLTIILECVNRFNLAELNKVIDATFDIVNKKSL